MDRIILDEQAGIPLQESAVRLGLHRNTIYRIRRELADIRRNAVPREHADLGSVLPFRGREDDRDPSFPEISDPGSDKVLSKETDEPGVACMSIDQKASDAASGTGAAGFGLKVSEFDVREPGSIRVRVASTGHLDIKKGGIEDARARMVAIMIDALVAPDEDVVIDACGASSESAAAVLDLARKRIVLSGRRRIVLVDDLAVLVLAPR